MRKSQKKKEKEEETIVDKEATLKLFYPIASAKKFQENFLKMIRMIY